MTINFNEAFKELYSTNFKIKNLSLQKTLKLLETDYTNDDIFEVAELILYCILHDRVFETKKLVDLINSHIDHSIYDIIKLNQYQKNKINLNLYRINNRKFVADYFLKFMKRFNYDTLKLLGVLTFNKNGYIRQHALGELLKYDFNKTIPYLIHRVNDRVTVISNTATEYILNNLNEENRDILLSYLTLFENLKRCNRQKTNIHKIITEYDKWIQKTDTHTLIYTFEREHHLQTKRLLLEHLIQRDDPVVVNFLKKYQYFDNSINNTMNNYLFKKLIKADFHTYLRTSSHPYQAFIYINSIQDTNKILPFIYHKSIAVQRHARYILRSYGRPVTVGDYLTEIKQKNYKRRHLYRGLIDTCNHQNLELLKQYLNHKFIYVRKLAFTRCCILNLLTIEEIKTFLTSELVDFATKTFIHYKYKISIQDLIELYQQDEQNIKFQIIQIMNYQSRWDAVEGLLTLNQMENKSQYKDLIYQALHAIGKRSIKMSFPLTHEQKMRITNLLVNTNTQLISELYNQFI